MGSVTSFRVHPLTRQAPDTMRLWGAPFRHRSVSIDLSRELATRPVRWWDVEYPGRGLTVHAQEKRAQTPALT
jgi:hypothetical protein